MPNSYRNTVLLLQMGETSGHKSKLVGITLLVLSLLLTVSVAALIYMNVTNGQTKCESSEDHSPVMDVQAELQIKTGNRQVCK